MCLQRHNHGHGQPEAAPNRQGTSRGGISAAQRPACAHGRRYRSCIAGPFANPGARVKLDCPSRLIRFYSQIDRTRWANVRVTGARSDQPRNSTHEVSGDHVTMQWYSNITKLVSKSSAPVFEGNVFWNSVTRKTNQMRSSTCVVSYPSSFDALCYSPSKRWTDLVRNALLLLF